MARAGVSESQVNFSQGISNIFRWGKKKTQLFMLHSSVVSSSGIVTGGGGESKGRERVPAAVWVPAGSAGNAAANIIVH